VAVLQEVAGTAFAGLSDADAHTTLALLSACPRQALPLGASAHPHHFRGAALLVLEHGVIAVRTQIPHGRRGVIVCHAGSGAILLPPAAGESLRVLEDALIVAVPPDVRDHLLATPAAAGAIVDALSATLAQKTRTIANLSSFHHADRVRSKLVQLAQDHGRVSRDGIRLDLRLTHDLLAEMVGSARETVTRALEELEKEGFVVRDGRGYILQLPADEVGSRGV